MAEPKPARILIHEALTLPWPVLLARACEALKSEPQRHMVKAWLEAQQQKEAAK